MDKYRYKAFGISMISEIELPDLRTYESESPDVSISIGHVPDNLPGIRDKGLLFQAAPSDFLFKLSNVGKFRAQNGNSITIEPTKSASLDEIKLFLLGSVFGAIIHQRGLLPIHGSSILLKSGAIVFTGKSASGKSSLAASFFSKGYESQSDDISVITKDKDERLFVQQGVPYLKLWKDVVDYLGITQKCAKVRPQLEKYIVPTNNTNISKPVNLQSIVYLVATNHKGYNIERITGHKKFEILLQNTYRQQYISGLDKVSEQFENISKVASSVDLYRIERPASPLNVNELADFVIKSIDVK